MKPLDRFVPRGRTLSADRWRRRHRAILVLLVLHIVALPVYAIATGAPTLHTLGETMGLALLTALAAKPSLSQRVRAGIATVALMTSSALLVHFSGGLTEAHFHFFIVMSLLSLYEDWKLFALGVAYVLAHHGLMGVVDPTAVVAGRPAGEAWKWAAVHGAYLAVAGLANLLTWQLNSDVREDARLGERRYAAVVDSVSQVIFQTDRHGRWTFLNPAFEEATGIPVAEAIGTPVLDFVHPDDREEVARLLRLRHGRGRTQVRSIDAAGESRWYEVRVHPASGADGVFGTLMDITARRRSEERLALQALHDPLTGLPNRTLFLDRLDQALARAAREEGSVALLFVDVDEFKSINDELGHEGGDAILRRVADVLGDEVRASDTAARLGGDEFALLCDVGIDRESAADIARRILGRLDHRPTVSIGVALGDADTPADALLREADAAMYRAKAGGRNTLAVFDETMRTCALERQQREVELRSALARDELSLRYEPIVSLEDRRVVGFEAMVCWDAAGVAGGELREIAEESGLIVPIGNRVIERICAQAAEWRRDDPDERVIVSADLSARQLLEPGLPDLVESALRESGIEPSALHLEITEPVVNQDDRRITAALERLAALGVHLILDDFGTGSSSLSSLRRFPLDAVKVDSTFIGGLDRDDDHAPIVTAIAGMTGALGLVAAAEGVKAPQQAIWLADLGYDYAQGPYFGTRLTAQDAGGLLAGQRSAAGQTIL